VLIETRGFFILFHTHKEREKITIQECFLLWAVKILTTGID